MSKSTQIARIHVIGWSNTGKTLLIELLLPHLIAAGLKVATAKHAHHGFDLDTPTTDSARHRVAGAEAVVLMGPDGWALQQFDQLAFSTICARLKEDGFDLVLAEGGSPSLNAAAIILPGGRQPPEDSSSISRQLELTTHPADLDEDQLREIATFCVGCIEA